MPPLFAHIGAAPGHGEDGALLAQDGDGAQHGIAADVVFLLKVLHGRQWTAAPLAFGDSGPEDGSKLLVGRLGRSVVYGHQIKLEPMRSDLSMEYICSALICSTLIKGERLWSVQEA